MTHEVPNQKSPEDRAAERWYLQIDGHRYGPVARAELEKFLRPPRLCSRLDVKCGDDGMWFSIDRDETIDKVLVKTGVEVKPETEAEPEKPRKRAAPPSPSKRSGWLPDFLEGLAAWVPHRLLPAGFRDRAAPPSSRTIWLNDFLEGLTAWVLEHRVVVAMGLTCFAINVSVLIFPGLCT
jgi:hypothetical protein